MSRQVSRLEDEHANGRAEQRQPENMSERKIKPLPSRSPKPLPGVKEQTSSAEGGFADWQTVIWREWCRCKDEDYAYYLFDLVKDTAFGQKFVVTIALLSLLLGGLAGYLIGSIMVSKGIYIGSADLAGAIRLILTWLMAFVGGTIGVIGSRRLRALYFWWQGQPSATRVEKALQQARTRHLGAEQIWAEPLRRLEQQKKQQNQPEQLIDALRSPDWIERFVAQKTLTAIGGEATEALRQVAADKSNRLWEVAIWLLAAIDQETTNRFAWRVSYIFCPRCLTRFDSRPVQVTLGLPFDYYGCRTCGQSREYLYLPQGIVAVLDEAWGKVQAEQDGLLKVNWLVHRASFDFDRVEIIRATDEDVERFAVQVGNDTDPMRQPRYKEMRCVVSADCQLSENTMRILRRTFGKVEQSKFEIGPQTYAEKYFAGLDSDFGEDTAQMY